MRACFVRGVWLPRPLFIITCLFATCLVGRILGTRTQAHAEDKRAAALNWVRLAGSETCIDASSLARRVEERLGRTVFPAPAQATLIVEGRAEKTADGFGATLRIFDQTGAALGSRDLSSTKPDCAELSEAVVLVLAVMIDPDGALAAIPSTAPEKPKEPAVKAPPVVTKSAPAPPPRAKRDIDLSMFARVELGSLPQPALGVGAAAVVSFAPLLAFRTEGAAFIEQDATQVGDSTRGASFGLLYASLEYCPLFFVRAWFGVVGCTGAQAGTMLSQSFGLDPRERDKVDPVVNGVSRLRLDLRVWEPMRLMLGGALGTPFLRTQYEITKLDGTNERLFKADAVHAGFDLGLLARF